ncbi:MAG: mannose-1-phosphate guanylyltransferase [Candidatus Saccharicenans sp.]
MNRKAKNKKTKPGQLPFDFNVVILAGGSGTRFWPLSRQKKPKQFLKIIKDRTLIEETFRRVNGLVLPGQVYTVAVAQQSKILRRLLPRIPAKNLLVEPEARNTAASLILATASIYLKNPEAVLAVLPADHYVSDVEKFRRKLSAAARAAYQLRKIILFGIPPVSPATGYGYIHCPGQKVGEIDGETFFEVQAFKEKPDLPTALEYLQSGEYFWNSGIFLWRADVFVDHLREYAPELFSAWMKVLRCLRNKDRRELGKVFREIPALSIDYALIEKIPQALMARGDFGWSDLGSWSSLYAYLPQDGECNSFSGKFIGLEAKNCLVFSPKKLTALVGVRDLIVVTTDDAVLVCHRDQDQLVKELVEKLKREGPEYL